MKGGWGEEEMRQEIRRDRGDKRERERQRETERGASVERVSSQNARRTCRTVHLHYTNGTVVWGSETKTKTKKKHFKISIVADSSTESLREAEEKEESRGD